MFDSLRNQEDGSPTYDLDPVGSGDAEAPASSPAGFLGMTARQRLILAVLFLVSVCILGTTCLLVTGAIRTY